MYGRINETTLTNIADAIRSQHETTTKYYPALMAQAIRDIPTPTSAEITTAGDAIISRTITSLVTNSFQTIGDMAFADCNALKSVYITSVNHLGFEAFGNCAALETVKMFAGNTSTMGAQVFFECPKLKIVDMTDIGLIGNYCFYNCTNLETLILRRGPYERIASLYHANALSNTKIANGTGYIYVPEEYMMSYTDKYNTTPWYTYVNQFRAIEDYPDICG